MHALALDQEQTSLMTAMPNAHAENIHVAFHDVCKTFNLSYLPLTGQPSLRKEQYLGVWLPKNLS